MIDFHPSQEEILTQVRANLRRPRQRPKWANYILCDAWGRYFICESRPLQNGRYIEVLLPFSPNEEEQVYADDEYFPIDKETKDE